MSEPPEFPVEPATEPLTVPEASAAVFQARAAEGEPDWRELARDVRRRFPKVMARLAE